MIGVFARKVARVQQRRALARWHWHNILNDWWILQGRCECGHQWIEHHPLSGRCQAKPDEILCGCGWLDETIVADATAGA